jgi:hypothetical protein
MEIEMDTTATPPAEIRVSDEPPPERCQRLLSVTLNFEDHLQHNLSGSLFARNSHNGTPANIRWPCRWALCPAAEARVTGGTRLLVFSSLFVRASF